RYILGGAGECDIVLADPGIEAKHLRLLRLDGGWQLEWIASAERAGPYETLAVRPGQAVLAGPVMLSIDEAEALWPILEQIVLVTPAMARPAPEDLGGAVRPQSISVGGARRMLARRAVGWSATVAAAGVSAAALVAWPANHPPSSGEARDLASREVTVARPPAAQKLAIETALAGLGLAGRAKVEAAGSQWLVRAAVMSDAESESLAAALARLHPAPALRMTTEQDLRDEVADLLLRVAPEYRGSVRLRYAGEARFRVEGQMEKAADRERLMLALKSAFPQVAGWDNALLTSEEMAGKLLAELRARGDWEIVGTWDTNVLHMKVRLNGPDRGPWERELQAAALSYPAAFIADVTAAPAREPTRKSVPLPFEVRGVVGGNLPYVVLSDGHKLARGGTWQGWSLGTVSASEIVFENGASRSVIAR
ncbi:MAG: hypothetical protein Q8N17_23875, partial [Burkholderiaceae bacterium]|nr:hypothetical protein [Burkholderiaceae bacterium]